MKVSFQPRHFAAAVRPAAKRAFAAALGVLVGISPVGAATARELGDLSIEELMNESVTSVSKREQKLGDVAAAVAVLSNDDLRRSGVISIADALRLVPGVNVGSVSSSQWAVSARGFNNLYANKLLVLVDGRAVYTPLFAGVYWDMQQPMLEDVDRVEVIRGPGATIWGANAVNGVINIVSRNAADTQGGLVYGGAGDGNVGQGGLRYGGAVSDTTFYRVYAGYQSQGAFLLPNGAEAGDGWKSWQSGVRVDREANDATRLTWQSDLSQSTLNNGTAHGYDFSTLGRWTRELASGGNVEVQAYYDRLLRDEALRSRSTMDTVDVALQHTFDVGSRHSVIWGAGYRFVDTRLWRTNPTLTIGNPHPGLGLYSAFAQDEFELVPDKLTLTAGVKLEHNDFTGFETQPSIRAVWRPATNQSVWAAVSRAVRTPSALEGKNVFIMELGPPLPGPDGGLYIPTGTGDGHPAAEVLWSYELGWRLQAGRHLSLDVATFYNRYSGIIGVGSSPRFVPGVPFGAAEMPFQNVVSTDACGGEAGLTFSPTERWRLSVSQAVLFIDDGMPDASVQYDPAHQTVLRSSHDLGAKLNLDLQVRRVGSFQTTDFLTIATVSAYTEADVRLAYRPTEAIEFSVSGRNLLHRQHVEQGFAAYAITTAVPRRVQANITWRF